MSSQCVNVPELCFESDGEDEVALGVSGVRVGVVPVQVSLTRSLLLCGYAEQVYLHKQQHHVLGRCEEPLQ